MSPWKYSFVLLPIAGLISSAAVSAIALRGTAVRRVWNSIIESPLRFEANQGQTAPQVRFISRGPGYTMLLSAGGATLNLRGGALRMNLVGGRPEAQADGIDRLTGVSNYLIGNDRCA